MYPHRIRLRGPWEIEGPDGESRRVNMPGDWSAFVTSCAAPWTLIRRFGLPRTLDLDESVFVVCEFDSVPECRLQDNALTPAFFVKGMTEFEITSRLRARNELMMRLSSPPGILGQNMRAPEFCLEIRGPVFLRGVVPTANGWTGDVVGEARKHLQIHLLAQGRLVARVPVEANQSFTFARPELMPEGSYNPQAPPWTIELVELANRWYSVNVQTLPKSELCD